MEIFFYKEEGKGNCSNSLFYQCYGIKLEENSYFKFQEYSVREFRGLAIALENY